MPLLNILDSPLGFLVERQAMLHALPMRAAGFSSRGKYFFLPREWFFSRVVCCQLVCLQICLHIRKIHTKQNEYPRQAHRKLGMMALPMRQQQAMPSSLTAGIFKVGFAPALAQPYSLPSSEVVRLRPPDGGKHDVGSLFLT